MMLRRGVIALALLALAAPPYCAAADEYDQLVKDFEVARQKWGEARRAQQGDEHSKPISIEDMPPDPVETFAPKFRAYAEKHAGDAETVKALVWLVQNVRPTYGPDGPSAPDITWAVEQLGEHHAASNAPQQILPNMVYYWNTVGREPLDQFCQRVIEKNKDKDSLGWAWFIRGLLKRESQSSLAGAAAQPNDDDAQAAVQIWRRVIKDYPDTSAAEASTGYIFETENLRIGMKAPEFEGENLAGEKITLSQFEGQVVVLDFWGFW